MGFYANILRAWFYNQILVERNPRIWHNKHLKTIRAGNCFFIYNFSWCIISYIFNKTKPFFSFLFFFNRNNKLYGLWHMCKCLSILCYWAMEPKGLTEVQTSLCLVGNFKCSPMVNQTGTGLRAWSISWPAQNVDFSYKGFMMEWKILIFNFFQGAEIYWKSLFYVKMHFMCYFTSGS